MHMNNFDPNGVNNTTSGVDSNGNNKPASMPVVVIMAILVTTVLVGISLVLNAKFKPNKADTSTQYVPQDVTVHNVSGTNTSGNTLPNNTTIVDTKEPINIGTDLTQTNPDILPNETKSDWLPFTVKYYGEQSEYVESIFTVSDIQGYAYTKGNTSKLKHVIIGSIDGLEGSFEIEVGYDIAIKLKIGTAFKVWYSTINVGGTPFVADVKTRN